MGKAVGRILKSEDVELQGRIQLDMVQVAGQIKTQGAASSTIANAHIAESHPEFAVIELICGCGAKTYLRCEYADGQPCVQSPQVSDGPQTEASSNKVNGEK